jgi:hypothetical protein
MEGPLCFSLSLSSDLRAGLPRFAPSFSILELKRVAGLRGWFMLGVLVFTAPLLRMVPIVMVFRRVLRGWIGRRFRRGSLLPGGKSRQTKYCGEN